MKDALTIGIGLPLEEPLLACLEKNGINLKTSPVFIQSFEVSNLKSLRSQIAVQLVQLVDSKGSRPFDFILAGVGEVRNSEDLMTVEGLKEILTYADIVAPYKDYLIPRVGNNLDKPTTVIKDAHLVGLQVHTWTMRPENEFLPDSLKKGSDPNEHGDSVSEILAFLDAGLNGFFTDAGGCGREAVQKYQNRK